MAYILFLHSLRGGEGEPSNSHESHELLYLSTISNEHPVEPLLSLILPYTYAYIPKGSFGPGPNMGGGGVPIKVPDEFLDSFHEDP